MSVGLPVVESSIHLSVESGCGGTTFGLQQARGVLEGEGRVVWVGMQKPDPTRFSQILGELHPVTLSRFHMLEAGELMPQGIDSARDLAGAMSTIELIVIDDWTPQTGSASSTTLAAIEALADCGHSDDGGILLISAAYADPAGKSGERGLKARGEKQLTQFGFNTWWLTPTEGGVGRRNLSTSAEEFPLQLETSGFESR